MKISYAGGKATYYLYLLVDRGESFKAAVAKVVQKMKRHGYTLDKNETGNVGYGDEYDNGTTGIALYFKKPTKKIDWSKVK
jgi:hypothetical protein